MENDEKIKKLKKLRFASIMYLIIALIHFIAVFSLSLFGKNSMLVWSGIFWLILGISYFVYTKYQLGKLSK